MTKGISTAPFWLDPDNTNAFPDVERALTDPDGLLAIGGDLSVERLTSAYRQGIFPWYSEGQPILWWSPNPRAVLFLDELKISRSLKKTLRKTNYHVTFDKDFNNVIEACAVTRRDGFGTWIVADMKKAYINLHKHGIAHSVEVWDGDQLSGGLYGVCIGSAFFGESMFSRQTDASKIALVYLVKQLQKWGFGFIDCQVYSDHLGTLGAKPISRQTFIQLVDKHCNPEHFSNTQSSNSNNWHYSITREDLFKDE